MTCKGCLHYEVCKHHDAVVDFPVDDGVCRFFGDRSKWVEQKHGRWIKQNWSVICSVCGCLAIAHDGKNFCPNCGALMTEGEG